MKKELNHLIKSNADRCPRNVNELKVISVAGKVKFSDYTSLLKIKCKVCGKTEEFNKWGNESKDFGMGLYIVCPICEQRYEERN